MKIRHDINITSMLFQMPMGDVNNPISYPSDSLFLQLPNQFLISITITKYPGADNLYWRILGQNGLLVPENPSYILFPGTAAGPVVQTIETDKKLSGPPYNVRLQAYSTSMNNEPCGILFSTSDDSGYSELVDINNNLSAMFDLIRTKPGTIIEEGAKILSFGSVKREKGGNHG